MIVWAALTTANTLTVPLRIDSGKQRFFNENLQFVTIISEINRIPLLDYLAVQEPAALKKNLARLPKEISAAAIWDFETHIIVARDRGLVRRVLDLGESMTPPALGKARFENVFVRRYRRPEGVNMIGFTKDIYVDQIRIGRICIVVSEKPLQDDEYEVYFQFLGIESLLTLLLFGALHHFRSR